ncbi:MAG: PqqD family protein [Ruminococcaceae bacterium]|nr:PqqD family protein [Oscillospiraceae bacterium]
MKIKQGFVLRELGESYIVVPTGDAKLQFNGMISFNGTGAFIWRSLEKGLDREETVAALTSTYEVDEVIAAADVDRFYGKLREACLVEE